MKKPTSEEREEKYQSESEDVREVYAGERIGEELTKIFEKYQLRESLYKEYALSFGDVVLGFIPSSQMKELLQERLGIPEPTALHLTEELTKLLPPSLLGQQASGVGTQTHKEETNVSRANTEKHDESDTQPVPLKDRDSEVSQESDERPLYPRMPDYSKPFTDRTPPQNDPYREPIE